jgi:hypothetical protein
LIKLGILKTGGALGIHQFSRVETENLGTGYPVPIFWQFKKKRKQWCQKKLLANNWFRSAHFPVC